MTSQTGDDKDITELDTDLLQPNPLQPRGLISSESLKELSSSIVVHGILEPLVVARTPAGYQIIAGERRWRAAKMAGLAKVPVVVKETTPGGMLEMAIVENVQRSDLSPIERGQAYERLMEEFGLSNQEISRRVGKSPAFISNSLKLLTIPDALKDGLISGATSEGHVRALASLEEHHLMIDAYKIVLKSNLSVRGAEELARKMKSQLGKSPVTKGSHIINDETDNMRNEIAKITKAKVRLSRSRAETRLVIVLKGSLVKTDDMFGRIYKALTSL